MGRTVAPRAERLIADFDAIVVDISDVAQQRSGRVTVAGVPSAAYYFMPRAMAGFQQHYPRVCIRLMDIRAGNVYSAVMDGQADFGLSFLGAPQPDVTFLPLVDEVYAAACRRDRPLARAPSVSWSTCYSHPWAGLDKSSGNRHRLDRARGELRPSCESVCETRHATTLPGMAEAGLGIAAVRDGAAGQRPSGAHRYSAD